MSTGGYSSASEYVRELVRADQKRKAKEALEDTLIEALRSGERREVTPELRTVYWAVSACDLQSCSRACRESIILTGLMGRKVREMRTSPARLNSV